MKRFLSNYTPLPTKKREVFTEKDQCVPNQAATITEVIYRFQGGIIPQERTVTFDPENVDENYIDIRNISGFDLTDAYHHLQNGRKQYQSYIAEVKAKDAQKKLEKEAEFKRLQEFEQNNLKPIDNGNNI